MAKWLKLYAMYTFSTKLDPCHYTTLLNVDILNFYLTLDLLQSDIIITRGQSNLTKSASRGAHSPVRGHPRGRKLYH